MSIQIPENSACSYCGGLIMSFSSGRDNYIYCFCSLCGYSWTESLPPKEWGEIIASTGVYIPDGK